MIKRIVYFIIPIILIGMLPAQGCGQTELESRMVLKEKKKGYLGVEVRDVNKNLMEKKDLKIDHGAYVDKVVKNSPAEKAGIEKGDVIIDINGKRIDDSEDLTIAVRKIKPKTEVKVEIIRKGERKSIPVVIGKMKNLDDVYNFAFNDYIKLNKSIKKLKIPKVYTNVHISSLRDINGLKVESMTKQLGEYFGAPDGKGVLVTEIEKGSNADKAGFKAGDVIVKVDKYTIEDLEDFNDQISDLEGGEVPIEIIRGGKAITLKMDFQEEEDTDDDEDEDWSFYNKIDPFDPPSIQVVKEPASEMDKIKTHIYHLRNNFKNNLRELKEKLRNYLRNL